MTGHLGPIVMLPLLIIATGALDAEARAEMDNGGVQFDCGTHLARFEQDKIYFAGPDHVLTLSFIDSLGASPQEKGFTATETKDLVHYNNLWPGIHLTYRQADGNIAESVWYIEPGSDVSNIRLGYNRRVELQQNGGLKIYFPTGWLSESKPVAWQVIDGERKPVNIAFASLASTEDQSAIGFDIGEYDKKETVYIDPVLAWNTTQGSDGYDMGQGIALDTSGNAYVIGKSENSWGNPVNAHSAANQYDIFVAKFNTHGELQWNTFLGTPTWDDTGAGIAVDYNDNIYVVGGSVESWGTPVDSYTGSQEVFVAKLDEYGALQWNTFMGSSTGSDYGYDIAVTQYGSAILVTGGSPDTWGSNPVNAHTTNGNNDIFVASLSGSGSRQWHTFLGSTDDDSGQGVALDTAGNVYVTGMSYAAWGTPVNAYTEGWDDIFIAKLNASGTLQWNTFMGSDEEDEGSDIAVDAEENIYVIGNSTATWGSPVLPFSGNYQEAVVAKLDGTGTLLWNSFLGSNAATYGSSYHYGEGIAVDCLGAVYVTGSSKETWGDPWDPHAGEQEDAFAARLDTSGNIEWNAFMGGVTDYGRGIAIDSGNVFVAGNSNSGWGTPINAFAGGIDLSLFKITPDPAQENTIWLKRAIPGSDGGKDPVLSDAHVAWLRRDTGVGDKVYVYDGSSTSRMTENSYEEQNLFASADYITWNSRTPDDIYIYDGSAVAAVTSDGSGNSEPKVSGNYLVWTQSSSIKLYDIINGVTSDVSHGLSPWISGNWISYQEFGNEMALYYDIRIDSTSEIASGRAPTRVSDDYFVYTRYETDRNEIRLQGRGGEWLDKQVSTGGTNKNLVGLSGDYVLFSVDSGDDRTMNDFLVLYDCATDTTTVIAKNVNRHEEPSMDGNCIVYSGYDGDDYEIYLYEIDSGHITQLTDNDTSDRYPKIRGDRIVWRAEDNDENSTIMMAYIKDASPWILFMPAILSAVETNN